MQLAPGKSGADGAVCPSFAGWSGSSWSGGAWQAGSDHPRGVSSRQLPRAPMCTLDYVLSACRTHVARSRSGSDFTTGVVPQAVPGTTPNPKSQISNPKSSNPLNPQAPAASVSLQVPKCLLMKYPDCTSQSAASQRPPPLPRASPIFLHNLLQNPHISPHKPPRTPGTAASHQLPPPNLLTRTTPARRTRRAG